MPTPLRSTNQLTATPQGPPRLLGRLLRLEPGVRWPVLIASAFAIANVTTVVVQFVSLATWITTSEASAVHWFFGAFITRGALALLQSPVILRVAGPIRRSLRRRALRSVMANPPSELSSEGAARLVTLGADTVGDFLASYLPALISAGLTPVLVITWIAVTDFLSGVIVGITVLVLPLFMALLGLEARDRMSDRFTEHERATHYFSDIVRGMATLRAHRRESTVVAQLGTVEQSLRDSTMATLRVAFLSSFTLELLASLGTALVALALGLRLISGHVTLPHALAVLLVTPEVYLPIRRAAARFHEANDGVVAAEHLLTLADNTTTGETAPPLHSLELDAVNLTYDDRLHRPRTVSALSLIHI